MGIKAEDYFSSSNRYLSNSKISKYLELPSYFKALYIDKVMKQLESTSLKKGKAVDVFITDSKAAFLEQYEKKVLKRENAELFEMQKDPNYSKTLMNETEWKQSLGMINALKSHSMFNKMKSYTAQQILSYDKKLNDNWDGFCGIPDWFKIEGDVCHIVDLKTARTVSTARSWFYKCKEYNYFNQFAMYSMLLKKNYPEIKSFTYTHWIVKNSYPNLMRVFKIDPSIVERAKLDLKVAIKKIGEDTQFVDPEITETIEDYEEKGAE